MHLFNNGDEVPLSIPEFLQQDANLKTRLRRVGTAQRASHKIAKHVCKAQRREPHHHHHRALRRLRSSKDLPPTSTTTSTRDVAPDTPCGTPTSPVSSCSSCCEILSLSPTSPRTSTLHIPNELLELVVAFFDTRERVHSISRVCKGWRGVCADTPWMVHERDMVKGDVGCGWVAQCNVVTLVLKSKVVAGGVLRAYKEAEGRVRTPSSLTMLTEVDEDDWAALHALQNSLVDLYVLTFRNAEEALSFPRLKHLTARQVHSDAAWSCLPPCLTSLTITRLMSGKEMAEQLPRFAQLKELKISTEFVPKGFLAIAEHCRGLRKLDLSGTQIDAVSLRAVLSNCRDLESLLVNGVESTPQCLGSLDSISDILCSFKHSLNLQHVFIKGMSGLTNAGLRSIFTNLKKLKSIKLNTNKDITDAGFIGDEEVPCTLPEGITSIQMSDCRHLTDLSLRAMSVSNLTELSLFCCYEMTPLGVKTVAEKCRQLRALYLFIPRYDGGHCTAPHTTSDSTQRRESLHTVLDDDSMRTILNLPHLEALRGFSCGALTAAAFPTEARPNVKTMELDFSLDLSCAHEAHAAMLKAFPNLRKLSLKSNEAVMSDETTADLAHRAHLTCLRACVRSVTSLTNVFAKASRILDIDYLGCTPEYYEASISPTVTERLFKQGKPVFLPAGAARHHSVVFREGEFCEGGMGKKLRVTFDYGASV